YSRMQGLGNHIGTGAVATEQGPLAHNLPETLDQVEPGGALGQRDEVEPRVAPVPQHRPQRPMQWQGIYNQVGIPRRGEDLKAIEEVEPGGGVAGRGGVQEDCTASMLQRPERPAVAVAGIVGSEMRSVGLLAPTRARVASGRDGTELIET